MIVLLVDSPMQYCKADTTSNAVKAACYGHASLQLLVSKYLKFASKIKVYKQMSHPLKLN